MIEEEAQEEAQDETQLPEPDWKEVLPAGDFRMVAKTMKGLEPVLNRELLRIGARDVQEHNRALSFVGDKGTMYKANFMLRTALRVLMPINSFEARNEQEYYDGIMAIDWSQWISETNTIAVDCTLSTEIFHHTFFMAQKCKDAVADQFRNKTGVRPSVDKEQPDLRINIHIVGEKVTVSLDSSGTSLHKRGYRNDTGRAPLNEVLAAGMIQLTGWEGRTKLIDPMCGSGTIPIEAALLGANIPAGYFREYFSFLKWKDFDSELWEKITEGAIGRINNEDQQIVGLEISSNTLKKGRENIHLAKVDDLVKTYNVDFHEWDPPEGPGILIMNPPYGERMDKDDITTFYKAIGDTLKKKYANYSAWIMSSNPEGFKSVGLKPTRRIHLFNGPLECRFMKFEMYGGSKRTKFQNRENPEPQ
ncbi:MAG TPA: THUMP domain-containing protein [Bacteroidia bacterium]|nr:THUMP domain-containing protein [Bacteroidia bacterium]